MEMFQFKNPEDFKRFLLELFRHKGASHAPPTQSQDQTLVTVDLFQEIMHHYRNQKTVDDLIIRVLVEELAQVLELVYQTIQLKKIDLRILINVMFNHQVACARTGAPPDRAQILYLLAARIAERHQGTRVTQLSKKVAIQEIESELLNYALTPNWFIEMFMSTHNDEHLYRMVTGRDFKSDCASVLKQRQEFVEPESEEQTQINIEQVLTPLEIEVLQVVWKLYNEKLIKQVTSELVLDNLQSIGGDVEYSIEVIDTLLKSLTLKDMLTPENVLSLNGFKLMKGLSNDKNS